MGPGALLVLLVATARHGKSRTEGPGRGLGEMCRRGPPRKDSISPCPSLRFYFLSLDGRFVAIRSGEAVEGKEGVSGVEAPTSGCG